MLAVYGTPVKHTRICVKGSIVTTNTSLYMLSNRSRFREQIFGRAWKKEWVMIIKNLIAPLRVSLACLLLLLNHWEVVRCQTNPGQCSLNLSSFPYVKYSECGRVQEDTSQWDDFPNTLCCRNALIVLSQALASGARDDPVRQGAVFLPETEWDTCTKLILDQQQSCGFRILRLGATKCSNVRLQDVQRLQAYQDAFNKCDHFDRPISQSCSDCTNAVIAVRDSLYEQLLEKEDNPVERAVCGVAALVSVTAATPDDHSVPDKFLRCWPPPQDHGNVITNTTIDIYTLRPYDITDFNFLIFGLISPPQISLASLTTASLKVSETH